MIHVAVGVIRKPDGRVLITRRAEDSHQGGRWEFPGGKVEPGEELVTALTRELHEELGIRPLDPRPLLRIHWHYPEKAVLLDTWEIRRFQGNPEPREQQPLRWVAPQDLPRYRFPDANGPIVTAAMLPETYLITPDVTEAREAAFLRRLKQRLAEGARLVQLRLPSASAVQWRRLAGRSMALAAHYGARLLVNGDIDLARHLGCGVHLRAAQLETLDARPLPMGQLVAASCHDARELQRATALEADFAVLGPVRPTASHPGVDTLGERAFADLIADVPVPVYALGGLGAEDVSEFHALRAQGVAAIRGLW